MKIYHVCLKLIDTQEKIFYTVTFANNEREAIDTAKQNLLENIIADIQIDNSQDC